MKALVKNISPRTNRQYRPPPALVGRMLAPDRSNSAHDMIPTCFNFVAGVEAGCRLWVVWDETYPRSWSRCNFQKNFAGKKK